MSEVQSATVEYGPEIFANNFWGKGEAGYDALIERLKQAKRTCEEVKAMYHERALIEEEYAKRLSKLSKFSLGKDETGTLRESLEITKLELEENAKEHMNLSQKMRAELEQDLLDFMTRQKEKRKPQQSIAERSLRNKQGQATLMQKAKEKYESECVKITGLLSSRVTVMGKELEKLNLKIEKAQMSAKAADQEYMQTVKTLADSTEKWNYDWRLSCDKFQDLEEERIDYLKRSLWNFTNLVSTVCVADDESCERIRVSLEDCDADKDILIFINERATGPEIPEPPTYVNFYVDSKENGSRFKKAAFDKFSTYADYQVEELEPENSQSITPSQLPPANNGIRYPQSKHALYNYLPEDSMSSYNNKMSERASMYANTSAPSTIKHPLPEIIDEEIEDDEPFDPSKPQMLSVGSNVLKVQTDVEKAGNDSTENIGNIIEKAIADMNEFGKDIEKKEIATQETVISSSVDDVAHEETNQTTQYFSGHSEKPESYHLDKPQPAIPGEQSSRQKDPPNDQNSDQSTEPKSEPFQQKSTNQSEQPSESKSAPIQQTSRPNSPSPFVLKQRFDHQRSTSSTYSSYQQLSATPSVISSTQSLKPPPVEGPGDLRRQPSTDYGPVSSQQQQIQENLAMRPNSLSLKIPNLQGPGDLRRTPSNSSAQSLKQPLPMSVQYDSSIVAEQIIPLDKRRSSSPNLQQQGSPRNNNKSIGIHLDARGRVVQDVLAETYVANDGRLPPINSTQQQQYPQQPGRQVYNNYAPLQNPANHSAGQIRPPTNFGRPPATGGYGAAPTNVTPRPSLRGGSRIIPPPHHSNTIGPNSLAHPNPYPNQNALDPQNRRSTIPGPTGFHQYQPRPDYQDPNFYATPRGPSTDYRQSMPARHPQITNEQKIQRTDDGKPIQFYVRTLFDYVSKQPDEISFTAGDIIAVLTTNADGWWEGVILDDRRKERGIFPCNYTEVLKDWIS